MAGRVSAGGADRGSRRSGEWRLSTVTVIAVIDSKSVILLYFSETNHHPFHHRSRNFTLLPFAQQRDFPLISIAVPSELFCCIRLKQSTVRMQVLVAPVVLVLVLLPANLSAFLPAGHRYREV